MYFRIFFWLLRACFIQAAAIENTHTDSPPYNNHAEIGFGNCFRALGVLECGDPGANVGAFVGNAAILPGAHSVRFTRGVSYNRNSGYCNYLANFARFAVVLNRIGRCP